jgi:RNA polymerase sigma-70 factor (ECF subfamily)
MEQRLDHSHKTDAGLLDAARRGDAGAFGELYRRHVGQVHAYLSRRLPGAASDLAAETFAQAWLSRRRFHDDHAGSALPWLLGIARNCLRESIRRDRVETRARERLGLPPSLADDDGYETVVTRLSPDVGLQRALAQLPEHERRALELRVIDELPYREVARTLAIRPAAARLRVSRALRRLSLDLIGQED